MPKSWILGLSLALTILFSAATGASGADSSDPLDQRPEPLTPKVPRTEAETDRVQAEALFAAGRMLEQRDDIAGALRRYQRAARYDPEGVPILRSVVDMAVRLRRNAEATRYALRYAELDASNAALMHCLARILTAEDNSSQAIALYDRALKANASLHTSETAEMLLELGRLQYLTKD